MPLDAIELEVIKASLAGIVQEMQNSLFRTGFTDTFIRRGRYPDFKGPLPFTPGYDLVGVVEETGPGVPAQAHRTVGC